MTDSTESKVLTRGDAVRSVRLMMANVLGTWAIASVLGGGAVWLLRLGPFWSAVGMQFVIWGLVDLVFAALGWKQSASVRGAPVTDQEMSEAGKLLSFLKVNHFLNVAYVLVGLILAAWALASEGDARLALAGHGAGVLVQGGFLLASDIRNELLLRRALM